MISIIVPVYNCEQYLHQCINSLIHQTYQNLEILLVDDGSTDSSSEICDEYARYDLRVKVIHKRNGGVSSARNAGIRAALGEYVMFVDADDWLDLNACEKIVSVLHDGIKLCFWASYQDERIFLPIKKKESFDRIVADIIACNGKKQSAYIRAVWAKVFARELVKNTFFPEEFYIGEDACFLLNCLTKIEDVKQILLVNDGWYHYRIVQNSAVRKYKPDLFKQSIEQYNYIHRYISEMCFMNNKNIATAMTIFCWQIFISLKINSLKEKQQSKGKKDCFKWAEFADAYLRNTKIQIGSLSKLQIVCWILYKLSGEKAPEKVIEWKIGKVEK